MALFHLTLASEGRLVLFPDETSLRAAVRALVRVAGERTLLFNIVDDHIHVVVESEDAAAAGRLGRAVRLAVKPLASAGTMPGYHRPVEGRAHLTRLLGYLLTQTAHHGLPAPATLWSGSCFLDLVGARVNEGFRNRLPEHLPRFRLREVWSGAGAPRTQPLEPASNAVMHAIGGARILESAAATLTAPPGLDGQGRLVQWVLSLFVQTMGELGQSTRETALLAKISPRIVQRLRHAPLPPAFKEALRLRVALEEERPGLPRHIPGTAKTSVLVGVSEV